MSAATVEEPVLAAVEAPAPSSAETLKREQMLQEEYGSVRGPCCDLRQWRGKLFTREDPHFFHKLFGLLSVLSFGYRYFYLLPKTGSLGFTGSWFDHATMFVHIMLSCSSLIFLVLAHRVLEKPLIIYEEYRLHAIVFSVRCFSVYIYALFRPAWLIENPISDQITLYCVVLAHHLVVDEITKRYGTPGVTAVRVEDKFNWWRTSVLRFYAFYQMAALAAHLTPNDKLAELGFNSLIAIQSSAFLMTLFRKGLISSYTHASIYTTCLILSLLVIKIHSPVYMIALCVGAYVLRTQFRLDKYFVWFVYCTAACIIATDNSSIMYAFANTQLGQMLMRQSQYLSKLDVNAYLSPTNLNTENMFRSFTNAQSQVGQLLAQSDYLSMTNLFYMAIGFGALFGARRMMKEKEDDKEQGSSARMSWKNVGFDWQRWRQFSIFSFFENQN